MDNNAANIIDLCLDGNAAGLQAALDDIMKNRINDVLAAKRVEFAQKLFNNAEEQNG